MKEERHILNAIRLNAVEKKDNILKVEGYAAHFDDRNHNYEIVTADCFTEFLDEMKKDGLKPMFTFNHDSNAIIGGWDEISTDDTGLLVRGHINTDVAFVRDNLLPLIEAGDLNHLSTEGWADGEWDSKRDAFVCSKFMLTAISLVALPADFAAKAEIRNKYENKPKQKQAKKLLI